jgi:hypothetical protein
MVLDRLDQREISLDTLAIEQKKQTLDIPFDPRTDVTQEDRDLMLSRVKGMIPGRAIFIDSEAALCINFLDPDKVKPWREEVWKAVCIDVESKADRVNAKHLVLNIAFAKLFFGSRYKELLSNIIQNRNEDLKSRCVSDFDFQFGVAQLSPNSNRWTEIILSQGVIYNTIVYPELIEIYGQKEEFIQGLKDDCLEQRRNKDWYKFALTAVSIKILFPQVFESLEVNSSDWNGMRAELSKIRGERRELGRSGKIFEAHLFNMLVLFCDTALDEDKFEMTYPKNNVIEEDLITIPQERNY